MKIGMTEEQSEYLRGVLIDDMKAIVFASLSSDDVQHRTGLLKKFEEAEFLLRQIAYARGEKTYEAPSWYLGDDFLIEMVTKSV